LTGNEKAKMLDRRIYALKLKIEEALLKGRAMRGE
jgi:hypothetical protein